MPALPTWSASLETTFGSFTLSIGYVDALLLWLAITIVLAGFRDLGRKP